MIQPIQPNFILNAYLYLGVYKVLSGTSTSGGLGNLYVDEMLFQTSVHPRTPASSITKLKRRALYKSMRTILLDVIAQKLEGRPYPNRFLIPCRQDGARCPRCGGAIQRTVIFGRTTYFCGTHQRT